VREMKKGALIIDDISHHELEKLTEIYKPDVIASGIKEKFIIEKMGIPCKQLHSYDYGGPYAAFTGAANFYREIDRMVNTKVWRLVSPPWKRDPQAPARLVYQPKATRAENEEATKTWKAPGKKTEELKAES
jgi:nitrogenase molybdenum-iron protein alpha chain